MTFPRVGVVGADERGTAMVESWVRQGIHVVFFDHDAGRLREALDEIRERLFSGGAETCLTRIEPADALSSLGSTLVVVGAVSDGGKGAEAIREISKILAPPLPIAVLGSAKALQEAAGRCVGPERLLGLDGADWFGHDGTSPESLKAVRALTKS